MALPEIPDLQQALRGRDDQNALRRHLIAIMTLIQAIVIRGDARLDDHDQQLAAGDSRLDALETATATGAQRLTALEAVNPLTITVVANLAGLPATAGVRQWFRVQGDTAVYVGNGAAQPLTKLVASSLP